MALHFKDKVFDVIHWRVIRQTEDRFDLLMRGSYLTVIVPAYYSDSNIISLMEKNTNNIYQALSIAEQMGEAKNLIRLHPEDYKQLLDDAANIKATAHRRLKKHLDNYSKQMGIGYKELRIEAFEEKLSDSDAETGTIMLNSLLHVMTEQALDAVIIHELCHLKYPNEGHSDEFRTEEAKWNPKSDDLYDLKLREKLRLSHLILGNCNVYDANF